ncbi:Methyltransferase sdnD [Colletotrichum fructicola]|uniref:Amino acid adenylation domain-containing protein n=1 Tax=Colletotrichum fructicola (strain Nara gc5) TaxID=1213859 RepID=L2GFN8_COLFN|nr:uncharacterized protein CGMCC3_g5939 [Colletotrichum fructicola]KAF4489480.1 Methyltransferase sdnD [Colletotrichum fructicola Nara gc5]KAI8289245.1 hypothetical protein K4K60_009290 [Colletotrichum sp. SAR11_57]KAE9578090.1 hypothetical protein CGMCC3_g5939 [Colletotrichum fructicola]KAF4425334.1 Methyltransferase sdnD [Colletotrichum fructicola]KAF4896455.1 Methyltransferase sdnD [Colletotrichum fructicola]
MTAELINLANGLSCYTSGETEARFIYNEIWEEHCYDGPELSENPVIVDAGANIGLFSIYMKKKYPTAKIIAFEPAPESFATLHRNFELNAISGVEAHQCGLGPTASAEKLTFYPTFPGNSTLRPETKKSTYEAIAERFGQEFVDTNFGNPHFVDIKIERLSRFLDGVERIDLLKVDVEGSELGVLQGVDDEHWKLIRNVVLETTESSGDRQKIEDLLRQKGFKVVREGAAFDSNMEFFVIRAHRDDGVGEKTQG